MSSHSHAEHPQGPLDNPDVQHETGDINISAVAWFVVILSVVVLSMNGSMWAMFKALQHFERKYEPAVSPLTAPPAQVKDFPAPSLQTTPWTDLKTFRAEQLSRADNYGWVDEKLGIAHVPVAKAKEMLLKKGIPVRPELGDATEGTHVAATGESNGGRTIPAGGPDRSGVPPAAPAAAPVTAPAAGQPASVPAATVKKTGGGL
jgi:hypothetical protein